MNKKRSIYSPYQYDRIRIRLLQYQHRYGLTPQAIANGIVERTGFEMPYEGGRKRVERFLNDANRASDDFVAAVDAFLDDFKRVNYEEAAAGMFRMTQGITTPSEEDIVRFAGTFHCEMRALIIDKGAGIDTDKDGQLGRNWSVATTGPPAYPVLRMRPMENSAGLAVWVALSSDKPVDDAEPESIQSVPFPGSAFRFGSEGLLILIRQPSGGFYFMVKQQTEEPDTLYGHGHFFDTSMQPDQAAQSMLPFEPHCEITMKRVSGLQGE